jgi:hypothetical protein
MSRRCARGRLGLLRHSTRVGYACYFESEPSAAVADHTAARAHMPHTNSSEARAVPPRFCTEPDDMKRSRSGSARLPELSARLTSSCCSRVPPDSSRRFLSGTTSTAAGWSWPIDALESPTSCLGRRNSAFRLSRPNTALHRSTPYAAGIEDARAGIEWAVANAEEINACSCLLRTTPTPRSSKWGCHQPCSSPGCGEIPCLASCARTPQLRPLRPHRLRPRREHECTALIWHTLGRLTMTGHALERVP